jgi:hypothetical protein
MVNYSPANFDAELEHIVTVILKLPLANPLALALSQSFVNTFDDFRTIDIDDVHEFRYNMTTCWKSIYFESRGSNLSSHIYQYGFARG